MSWFTKKHEKMLLFQVKRTEATDIENILVEKGYTINTCCDEFCGVELNYEGKRRLKETLERECKECYVAVQQKIAEVTSKLVSGTVVYKEATHFPEKSIFRITIDITKPPEVRSEERKYDIACKRSRAFLLYGSPAATLHISECGNYAPDFTCQKTIEVSRERYQLISLGDIFNE